MSRNARARCFGRSLAPRARRRSGRPLVRPPHSSTCTAKGSALYLGDDMSPPDAYQRARVSGVLIYDTAILDCFSRQVRDGTLKSCRVSNYERFLGLAISRILSRHLASFSPTHIAISVSQPAAARFTLAPASGREQDRGRKPRFPRKLHEVGVETSQERRSQGCIRGDAG